MADQIKRITGNHSEYFGSSGDLDVIYEFPLGGTLDNINLATDSCTTGSVKRVNDLGNESVFQAMSFGPTTTEADFVGPTELRPGTRLRAKTTGATNARVEFYFVGAE